MKPATLSILSKHALLGALVVTTTCNRSPKNDSAVDEPGFGNGASIVFTDITNAAGIDFIHYAGELDRYIMRESMAAGCALLDYDNDGDLDVYCLNGTYWHTGSDSLPRNRLYEQYDPLRFRDVTEGSGTGDTTYGMGVAVGDIDNDGAVDMYLANDGPDVLLRNRGDGTFEDITEQAGIVNPSWGAGATFSDYDNDGFLDLYVTNYVDFDPDITCTDMKGRGDYCGPKGYNHVPDRLFHNNGDGTFTDVSKESGVGNKASYGLNVVSWDFNHDYRADFFVANDGEPNYFWINRGDGTFEDRGMELGVAVNRKGESEAGMGVAVGDVDDDGDFDMFVTHFMEQTNTLYMNLGDIGFADKTMLMGDIAHHYQYTGLGTTLSDLDRDGDLDIAYVNGRMIRAKPLIDTLRDYWDIYSEPDRIYRNDGGGRFVPLTDCGDFCATMGSSRGLAAGDVDNDGDIDLLVSNGGEAARLFRNDSPPKGAWLSVSPLLRPEGRLDYGAIVEISLPSATKRRLCLAGYSYCSSSDPRVHVGLGQISRVDSLSVVWTDGTREHFEPPEPNSFVRVVKGHGRTVPSLSSVSERG